MLDDSYKSEVKRRAHGHWRDILQSLGISANRLDGRGHPCPKCGGTDRFTFTNRNDGGGLLCRKCGEHIGDGLAAVQWLTDCDFPTALKIVADYLHIPSNATFSIPQVGEIQTPAVSSVPLALSSVSVSEPTDDKPTTHETEHIADESNHESKREPKHETERVDHIYRDIDENGQVVERYRVSRINHSDGSKTIRKPTGFNKSKDGILYHLDRIKRDLESPIYWVEGEKDADRLTAAGYLATTCGACHDWKPEYAEPLRGREVIVLYDCDEPGKKLAKEVIRDILPVVSSLRVVNIEPLYMKAVERLRSLVNKNVDHEADDPLYAEREQRLNHPPKGMDISDYLDVLRASRSPDSDWSESEDRLEIRNLIYSGHSFTVNIYVDIESQLPFLDRKNQPSEAKSLSLDVIRNPVTIPREEYSEDTDDTRPDFPVDALSGICSQFVEEASCSLSRPPEMLAALLLPTLAGVIGNSRCVLCKSGWIEPSILWAVIIANRGEKKTPVFDCVKRFIEPYESRAYQDYRADKARYDVEEMKWKQACKRSKGEDIPPKPDAPTHQGILLQNTTIEAAIKHSGNNPRGLLLMVDELSGWFGNIGRYAKGGDKGAEVSFWLESYNGKSYTCERASHDIMRIEHLTCSIAGTIQPKVFQKAITELGAIDNGLLDRFLCVEVESIRNQWTDSDVSASCQQKMQRMFDELFHLSGECNDNGVLCPKVITLHPDATKIFREENEYYEDWKEKIYGRLFHDTLSKMPGRTARIALVLHCIDYWSPSLTEISCDTMRRACEINRWFAKEMERQLNQLPESQALETQNDLKYNAMMNYLHEHESLPQRIADQKRWMPFVTIGISKGILDCRKVPSTGGRSRTEYLLKKIA